MEKDINTLKVSKQKGKVNGRLQLIILEEGKHLILYLPALEISAYGDNYQEAHGMLKEALDDCFGQLIKLSDDEIHAELKKLGWNKKKHFRRVVNLSDTTFEDIKKQFGLDEDSDLRQIQKVSMEV